MNIKDLKNITKEKNFKNVLITVIIIGIVFLALTALVWTGNTKVLDTSIFNGVISIKNSIVTSILRVITDIGSATGVLIILGIMLLVMIVLKKKEFIPYYKYLLINVFLGAGAMKVIKSIVQRPRPEWRWIKETGYSYPSGHTICSVMLYGTLILIVSRLLRNKKKAKNGLIIFFSVMAVLIGLSRVYFGVHYFTDVLASMIIGSALLVITDFLMDWEFKSVKDKNK